MVLLLPTLLSIVEILHSEMIPNLKRTCRQIKNESESFGCGSAFERSNIVPEGKRVAVNQSSCTSILLFFLILVRQVKNISSNVKFRISPSFILESEIKRVERQYKCSYFNQTNCNCHLQYIIDGVYVSIGTKEK